MNELHIHVYVHHYNQPTKSNESNKAVNVDQTQSIPEATRVVNASSVALVVSLINFLGALISFVAKFWN